MKRLHFLLSIVLGIFVYVLLSFVCGKNGVLAQHYMQEQFEILSLKERQLQKQNDYLKNIKESLLFDDDVVLSYAKKIGFVGENEKIIKINGLKLTNNVPLEVEKPYFKTMPSYIDEKICKISGFVVFLVFSLLSLLKDKVISIKVVNQNVNNAT